MKSQHKKIVAFLRFSLDTVGENFIYEEGRHFKKYSPLVLCGIVKRADENVTHYCYREFSKLYQRQWPELPQGCGDIYRSGISKYHDIIKRLPVKILHAQFLTDAYFYYPLVKECGIPLIVSLRGYDLFHPGIKIFLSTVLPFTSKFVVKSKSMKDVLASYGCDPGMIEVVYGGIDTGKIIFKPRVPVKNKIRILSAGRFVEKKGYDVTWKFFSELLKDNPEAQLTLVGEGELEKDLIKKIRYFGIAANVQIKGYMPHALFIKELYRHNLFVLSSRKAENGDQEGIPNVLKEAMASGMPVISTYHSGIPELIHDRKTGYLVEENDDVAILDKLKVVMADKEKALQVCLQARSAVEKKFQVKNSAAQIERLYDTLLLEGPMKKNTPGDGQGHVAVSVIIPTFNGEQRLLLLLMSLENQTDKNFEVIVVDDGSTDGTRESVARVMEAFPVPLRYYYLDNMDIFGAGQARNYGAKQAKGDVLLFLDQDCVAAHDLIKKHSDHHQVEDVVLGYYAGYTDEEKCYDFTKLKDYVQQKKAVPVMKEFRDGLFTGAPVADAWKCFVSAHFSIKKEIFHEIHFDESFTQWGCEDIDLGYRLFQAGKAICFAKDCIAYNSSESRRRTKKKFLTLCESLIAMYKKYQTDEVRLYCFERFYHTPLKYRDSLLLIFKNNIFEIRESQTSIVIEKNYHARVVLGPDLLDAVNTIKEAVPLIRDVHFDISFIKTLEEPKLRDARDSFYSLIKILRDKNIQINLHDIRRQSFLMGVRFLGPEEISLDFYNKCNVRCLFCPIHSPLRKTVEDFPDPPDADSVENILDGAYEMGVQSIRLVSEGEPLLAPDICRMLERIAVKGFELNLVTNITLLNKDHLVLLNKINQLSFLINFSAAKKETYQKIYGGDPQNYDFVLRSLLWLSRLKHQRKKSNRFIYICTTYIITNLNYQEIADYVLLAKRMGVDHVYFKFAILYGEGENLLLSREQMTELRSEVLKAKAAADKLSLSTTLDEILRNIDDQGFQNKNDIKQHTSNLPSNHCYNGWFFGRIVSNGNYYICCRTTVPVGNIRENTLKEIFFSTQMGDLLAEGAAGISLKKKMWSKCNYCYHLRENKTAKEWLDQK